MFEHTMIESQKRPLPKSRWLNLPVAVAIHAVVFGSWFLIGLWEVEAVPEPPINVSFVTAAAPPPPPPPSPPPPPPAAPRPQVTEAKPIEVPTEPVQPVEIPDEIPEVSNEPAAATDYGVEGGVEGGVPGGQLGGVVGGAGDAPPPPQDEILRVGGDIQAPVKINAPLPRYPEIARRARVQGVVIVEAVINKAGSVESVRVLKGLPMGLDTAAVDTVKKWKFKPATLNGKPVTVYYTLTVNFQLQ